MNGAPARNAARSHAIAAGVLVVVAVVYTWAQWRYFTTRVSGGNDFMAHYAVWHTYLREGLNPYSDEATLQTQRIIYGRPAEPGEDSNQFAYPVYSFIVHGPFLPFQYPLARAIFMTVSQAGLILGVVFTLRLLRWAPPLWLVGLIVIWSVLNYHEARAIILGQVAVLGYGWFAAALYALHRRRDILAGIMLVLLTVKPPLVFLAALFLTLWAARHRRWTFIVTFIGGIAGLSLIGLLFLPTWIQDWLTRVLGYGAYVRPLGLIHAVTHEAWPALGAPGEYGLIAVVLAWMGYTWWQALKPSTPHPAASLWALGVTTWVTNVIVAQAATPNYVLMLLPTLWVFAALDRRAGLVGRWGCVLIMLAMAVGHWWLHMASVVGNLEQGIMFVPWPAALLAPLVFGRQWLMTDAEQAGATLE